MTSRAVAPPRIRMRGVAVLAVLGLALAGCTPGGPDTPSDDLDHQQMQTQYDQTKVGLEFPPDYPADRSLIAGTSDGGVYEGHYGEVMADMEWECAWEASFVTHPASRPRALELLRTFPDTRTFRDSYDTGVQDQFTRALGQAEKGDDRGFRELAETSCADLLG